MQVAKKVSKQKMPDTASFSGRSAAPDATHRVERSKEVLRPSNPDAGDVAPEMRAKAYKARPGSLGSRYPCSLGYRRLQV